MTIKQQIDKILGDYVHLMDAHKEGGFHFNSRVAKEHRQQYWELCPQYFDSRAIEIAQRQTR